MFWSYAKPLSSLLILAVLYWLEHHRPLRPETESKLRRVIRNLSVAATSAIVILLVERPVVLPLARLVEQNGWGLLKLLPLPG